MAINKKNFLFLFLPICLFSNNISEKLSLAENPNTSIKKLIQLSKSDNPFIIKKLENNQRWNIYLNNQNKYNNIKIDNSLLISNIHQNIKDLSNLFHSLNIKFNQLEKKTEKETNLLKYQLNQKKEKDIETIKYKYNKLIHDSNIYLKSLNTEIDEKKQYIKDLNSKLDNNFIHKKSNLKELEKLKKISNNKFLINKINEINDSFIKLNLLKKNIYKLNNINKSTYRKTNPIIIDITNKIEKKSLDLEYNLNQTLNKSNQLSIKKNKIINKIFINEYLYNLYNEYQINYLKFLEEDYKLNEEILKIEFKIKKLKFLKEQELIKKNLNIENMNLNIDIENINYISNADKLDNKTLISKFKKLKKDLILLNNIKEILIYTDKNNLDYSNITNLNELKLIGIAKNKTTPIDILIKLSKNKFWTVREQVALNKNTPKNTLIKLSKDKNNFVKIKALHSLNNK